MEGSWGAFEAYWRTLMLDCTRYPIRRLREEDLRELRPKFAAWLMAPVGVKHSEWTRVELSEGRVKRTRKKDLAKEARGTVTRHLLQVHYWVFAILENGRYAMVPAEAERGDQVAVLKGAKTPVLLRNVERERRGKNQDLMMKEWKFVGSCYVHGLMDGEVVTGAPDLVKRQFFLTQDNVLYHLSRTYHEITD